MVCLHCWSLKQRRNLRGNDRGNETEREGQCVRDERTGECKDNKSERQMVRRTEGGVYGRERGVVTHGIVYLTKL